MQVHSSKLNYLRFNYGFKSFDHLRSFKELIDWHVLDSYDVSTLWERAANELNE